MRNQKLDPERRTKMLKLKKFIKIENMKTGKIIFEGEADYFGLFGDNEIIIFNENQPDIRIKIKDFIHDIYLFCN